MLQPVLFLVVGFIVVFLIVGWVIALVRKVGGCLIHLLLLAAGLILFLYLSWLFWQRFLQG
jgi:xanthine/uracil permease